MSTIGSPIQNSVAQVAQTQQQLGKARDRNRAVTDAARRFQDLVDLRVAGVETSDAVRPLSDDESQQQGGQQPQDQAKSGDQPDPPVPPSVDVKA